MKQKISGKKEDEKDQVFTSLSSPTADKILFSKDIPLNFQTRFASRKQDSLQPLEIIPALKRFLSFTKVP